MSEQRLKILAERKLLSRLTKVTLTFGEHCVISKQHILKFDTSNFKSKIKLEPIHSDAWQASIASLGKARYFLSFIDDFSR